MSEYPEDIMKTANEVALEIWKYLQSGGYMGHHETITPIAAAILAERERCASIADKNNMSAWGIAHTIRKGGAA